MSSVASGDDASVAPGDDVVDFINKISNKLPVDQTENKLKLEKVKHNWVARNAAFPHKIFFTCMHCIVHDLFRGQEQSVLQELVALKSYVNPF